MLTEIAQARVVGELIPRQLFGREREKHLPTVRRSAQAGAAVDRGAEVIPLAQRGVTRVKGQSHAQWRLLGPGLDGKGPLQVGRGSDGVGRSGEDGEEAVPLASLLDEHA